jgi:hypothetical protein
MDALSAFGLFAVTAMLLCLRRAHEAMLKSKSTDLLTLARLALEAAIRNENDLLDLLHPEAVAMSALRQTANIVISAWAA